MNLLLIENSAPTRKSFIDAILLDDQRRVDFENPEFPAWEYTPTATAVHCKLPAPEHYTVAPDAHGRTILTTDDGNVEDLDDHLSALIRNAENRLRLNVSPESNRPFPAFLSSRRDLVPHSCEVILRLSARRLSDLADVRAYLDYWRHKESKDEILAMKPLSKEFAQVAEQATLFEGLWLPVSVNGSILGGLRLGAAADAGDIPAELHTEHEISFSGETRLTRTVSWMQDGRSLTEVAEVARVLSYSSVDRNK